MKNAALSLSEGVEFEGQWVASQNFRLSANVAYLDSHYVRYANGPGTVLQQRNGQQFVDLSGVTTAFAPRWSGSINASYSMWLPGDYKFSTSVSPYFTSSYNDSDPFARQAGYVRLDGRLTIEKPDGRWAVDLIGKNLTDRQILITDSVYGDGYGLLAKQESRHIAVQARFKW